MKVRQSGFLVFSSGGATKGDRELETDRDDARSSSFRITLRAKPNYFAAAAHPVINIGFAR